MILSEALQSEAGARHPGTSVDYETYDNDINPSDADYSMFVNWLSERTASELREAKSETERQKQALCRYYRRGAKANLTMGELIDFLGVSSPSILDMADYTEEEGDAVMQISDNLSNDEINQK